MPPIENEMEDDSTVYMTLLESTKTIPWKIDWSTLKFAYIGPQIERLLGWSPASWVSPRACTPAHRDEAMTFIETVDQRLYQAKQKGRNCIVSGA